MAKTSKKDEKRLLLRIPMRIAKALKARADKNQRSMNGQILFELDQNID